MRSASAKTRGTWWCRVALFVLGGVLLVPLRAFAGRITLAWDPSPDAVAGYTIYWGTSPGTYTFSVDTTQTSHTIQGLTNGVRYYFVVKAFSSAGLYSAPSNEVNGLPANLAPLVTNPGDRNVREGSFSLAIAASDPDGDPLTYSATGLAAGLSINASTGLISGTAAAGVYSVTVSVSDGQFQSSATFTVTVTANRSPVLDAPVNQTSDTDDLVGLQLVASDPDGDSLTYSATGLPPDLTINPSSGLISGPPAVAGTYPVTVTVSDGGLSDSRSFTWIVVALPSPLPVSRWNFDDGMGTTAADPAGGRHGTLTNGAAWIRGRSASAVSLDGTNDYVALPAFDVTGSSVTLAAWVRSSSLTSDRRFIAKASGTTSDTAYWTLGTSGSTLRFQLRTGSVTTTLDAGTVLANTWYHAVATYNGATMRLYLNGVLVGSTAKTGPVATGASVPVSIGRNPGGTGSQYVQGAIDDVHIFSRALTAAEVAVLYAAPILPPSNQAPVITDPGDRTTISGAYSLSIVASDPDGDPLTFSATGLPTGLTINASTGVISGGVAGGTYTITVTASDGQAQASTSFVLTATVNNSPTLQTPPNQSSDTDDIVSLQLIASDPDGNPLTFSASGLPAGLTLNTSTGLITGTPVAGTGGVHSVTVSVSDGSLSVSRTFSWTVLDLNPSGLVSHWKMDEGSGTVAADTAGGRTGALTNGAAWTAGRFGMAASLDGVNDYISLPTFDLPASAITMAAWVRTSSFSADTDQRILSKAASIAEQDHYWMLSLTQVAGSPRLRFRLKTGATTTTLVASSGTVPINTWYHAAATYDGATMRLYLNGTLVGSAAKSGGVATNAAVPVSAGRNPDGSNYMHGAIDDVRVYSRALSASELAAIMNPPTGLFTDDPLLPGVHMMRAVHITELRTRIDALRVIRGLGLASWTPIVANVTIVQASHIAELRSALNAVYAALGRVAPLYTDGSLAAGMPIKAVHITELRAAVRAVE